MIFGQFIEVFLRNDKKVTFLHILHDICMIAVRNKKIKSLFFAFLLRSFFIKNLNHIG